jgi:hypothetical protein
MTSFSMIAPNFADAQRYRVTKHGIGLNMFYRLWEVFQLNELYVVFKETS